jgi:6-phosphogluconolactonase
MSFGKRFSVAGLAAFAVLAAIPAGAQELVYTSNFGDSTVSGFGLNMRTGVMTETPGSPYGAGVGPEQMAASADGSFVYVAAATWYAGGPCGTNYAELDTYKIESGNGRLLPWQATPLPAWCPSAILATGNDVYVVLDNFGGNKYGEIAGYESSSGSLKPITGSPFPSPIAVSPGQQPAISGIALSHDGKVMYAADPNDAAGILIFDRIPKTGALLFRDTFNSGAAMGVVTVSPSGKFLAAFPAGGNFVYMYAIGTDGSLTAVPGSPFATPNTNEQTDLAFSPDGKFLALSEQGGVTVLTVNASGQLAVVPGSPFGSGFPGWVAFDPTEKFVIVPGTVFQIDSATGVLTQASTFVTGGSGMVVVKKTGT